MQIYVVKLGDRYLCYSSLGYGLIKNYGCAEIYSSLKQAEWHIDYLSEEAQEGSEFYKFNKNAVVKTWHIQEQ